MFIFLGIFENLHLIDILYLHNNSTLEQIKFHLILSALLRVKGHRLMNIVLYSRVIFRSLINAGPDVPGVSCLTVHVVNTAELHCIRVKQTV